MYLPLYLIFFVLSKKRDRYQLVANIVRSSCFLATYCFLGWASGCVYYSVFERKYSRLDLIMHTYVAKISNERVALRENFLLNVFAKVGRRIGNAH